MSAGAADILSVTNKDRRSSSWRRLTGQPHVFMQFRAFGRTSSDVKQEGVKDGKELDKKAGFEVAEFSRDISGYGPDSRCIAVQRYTNPMYTGYKRQLVGVGCTVGDLQPVYQILQHMEGDCVQRSSRFPIEKPTYQVR